MTSRLKSGRFIGAATSESARRQLMQPVPCWERIWIVPESAAPGSNLKVIRWVKTDKKQQFSDDEDAADEPLAPLPDEPIQDEDEDEEKEQDDGAESIVPSASRDASEPVTAQQSVVAPEEPKPHPHPLSMSLVPADMQSADDVVGVGVGVGDDDGTLDTSLNPTLNALSGVNVEEQLDVIDIRQFGAVVEGFDPNAVENQVMQDALQNGMPMLGK